jgi:hypothetical protein
VSTSLLGSQKLVRTETTVSAAIKIQDAHYTRRLCRCRRGHGKPASGVTKQHNMVGIDPGLLPQREPPKKGGILAALRRSPLVGAELNPARSHEGGRKVNP